MSRVADIQDSLGRERDRKQVTSWVVAADMEDRTEKHPVTPGEVIPARQLLADMFMQLEKPAEALAAYEADLKRHPNRFNALYGAGLAAEKSGNLEKSRLYFRQLQDSVASPNADRIELTRARQAQQ